MHTLFGEGGDVNEHGKRPPATPKTTPKKRVKTFNESDDETTSAASSPSKAIKKQQRREEAAKLLEFRKQLPVWTARDKIVESVQKNDTVILLGATGSGKTTQIPQFLLSAGYESIACTQPRRVAAITLAARVAAESGSILGSKVGYTVRFDDKTNQKTRLRYITDGSLLAEMLSDRNFERYDVIVVDEAHERSLRTDMLLGFLKHAQLARKQANQKPLKIVVMSATIDAERFSEFFDKAPVLYVQGRLHDVRLLFAQDPVTDYIEATVATILSIHVARAAGTVLVFLPGQDDIESVAAALRSYLPDLEKSYSSRGTLDICPLYARLSTADQAKPFAPASNAPGAPRKIVLATNIAETSVTIPGVKYVIDTGLAKEKSYKADSGVDSLQVSAISKSSAKQRAGRAGREGPGICFRLYTERDYDALVESTVPEIKRVALPFALLHLLASGADNVFSFPYMDRPSVDNIESAMADLIGLGAIDETQKVTDRGRKMANLPVEPSYAAALIASFERGCSEAVLSLVSLISARDAVLVNASGAQRDKANAARHKFSRRSGDHLTLLNILKAFEETEVDQRKAWCRENFVQFRGMQQVLDTRRQLKKRCERLGLDTGESKAQSTDLTVEEEDAILECLLQGLYNRVALRRQDGRFEHATLREPISIHPGSTMHGRNVPAFMYDELVLTSKPYARGVSAIQLSWLSAHPFYRRP